MPSLFDLDVFALIVFECLAEDVLRLTDCELAGAFNSHLTGCWSLKKEKVSAMESELEVNVAVLVGFLLKTAHELQHLRLQLLVKVKTWSFRGRIEESHWAMRGHFAWKGEDALVRFFVCHKFISPEVRRPSADKYEVLEDLCEFFLLHPKVLWFLLDLKHVASLFARLYLYNFEEPLSPFAVLWG